MTGSEIARDLKLHAIQSRLLRRAIAAEDHVRVLIVEDDPDHAELVSRALEPHDFDVTVVTDGPSCLDAVVREAYSIILLDYGLPRMNGLEVLGRLRALAVACPVVMITAQGDERLAIEALKAGGIDFVVKTAGYLAALPTILFKVLKQYELARENARLHHETRRQLRNAEALVDLDRTLTSTLALEPLLEIIGQTVARTCDVDRCLLFLCDGDRLVLAAGQFADGAAEPRLTHALGAEGIALDATPFLAETVRGRKPVVITDPARDPRVPAAFAALGGRVILALPLLRNGAVIGTLVLDRLERAEAFGPGETLFGVAVASHVALALDNARLYENAQHALAEVRAAQDQLVRGETLRALGELASGVAHHLNNLLAVISGRTQLLLRSQDTDPIRRPLEIIERASADGAEVVRRIQEFARTRPAEGHRPVDLNQIVEDVVEMSRARWHDAPLAHGVVIEIVRDLDAVPPVPGHAAALREAVMNLLFNAVDAMSQGGRISIRTRREGAMVSLAVIDEGIGMPAEILNRAQEPFFTTKGVKSMGLGLSVTYGIVERHGGQLAIESTAGGGTTATMRLPANPAGTDRSAPAEKADRSRMSILLVDDEGEVREVMAELLEADGHTVIQAPGPLEALARLAGGLRVDLLLTDLGMPVMTGGELAVAAKARWPGLRVGLITGWGEEAVGGGQGNGADFVLQKPFDLEAFYQAVIRTPAGATRG